MSSSNSSLLWINDYSSPSLILLIQSHHPEQHHSDELSANRVRGYYRWMSPNLSMFTCWHVSACQPGSWVQIAGVWSERKGAFFSMCNTGKKKQNISPIQPELMQPTQLHFSVGYPELCSTSAPHSCLSRSVCLRRCALPPGGCTALQIRCQGARWSNAPIQAGTAKTRIFVLVRLSNIVTS